jgi:chemotaxis protein CheD
MYIVGIGEYMITSTLGESIATYALGSCVALILHCKKSKQTAMAHIVLPHRDLRHRSGPSKPAYFAVDIVPRLIEEFLFHPKCDASSIEATLVGGAESKNRQDVFKVGERNLQITKKLLEKHQVPYLDYETLGHYSRTVEVFVDTGTIKVKKQEMLL